MNKVESQQGATAISRRDMLRRSAVLGGALAVAAPTVQSFTRPAFAESPPDEVEDRGWSNLFVFITCNGAGFRIRLSSTGFDSEELPGPLTEGNSPPSNNATDEDGTVIFKAIRDKWADTGSYTFVSGELVGSDATASFNDDKCKFAFKYLVNGGEATLTGDECDCQFERFIATGANGSDDPNLLDSDGPNYNDFASGDSVNCGDAFGFKTDGDASCPQVSTQQFEGDPSPLNIESESQTAGSS